MGRLRYLTAGESHGPALVAVIEGLPAGVSLTSEHVNADLHRRQQGYGRGGRQKIETDRVRFRGGLRFGKTLGSPLAIEIENADFASWTDEMAPEGPEQAKRPVKVPRPGHADYAGGLKYRCEADLRPILERASARETAIRVAAGAVAKRLLDEAAGIALWSRVLAIGGVEDGEPVPGGLSPRELNERADASPVRALSESASRAMVAAIDEAMRAKETLGGVIEVRARGCPVGLGSHVQWDRKLDGRIAQAMMAIPAIKGVEVGDAWDVAAGPGTRAHDPFVVRPDGTIERVSNRAGGIEGGITNGEEVVVRGAMKPLSTIPRALPSFDWTTKEPAPAHVERHDVCAVPAAAVIGEALLALVLADALLEKFGGDSLAELRERVPRR
ncbi:MAG TPA: chorismate synthase [Planctomycetota bacterium]|nr:chorismate synthase [Planctomycetota bacterium]